MSRSIWCCRDFHSDDISTWQCIVDIILDLLPVSGNVVDSFAWFKTRNRSRRVTNVIIYNVNDITTQSIYQQAAKGLVQCIFPLCSLASLYIIIISYTIRCIPSSCHPKGGTTWYFTYSGYSSVNPCACWISRMYRISEFEYMSHCTSVYVTCVGERFWRWLMLPVGILVIGQLSKDSSNAQSS